MNIKKHEEDYIFRKRLLYDGHGPGEDRRLLNLTKMISKICQTEPESEEELAKSVNGVSKDLSAAILSAEKHEKTEEMLIRTLSEMRNSTLDRAQKCEEVKSDIAKLELDIEFIERLKKVEQFDDCDTTNRLIEDVQKQKERLISRLEKNRAAVNSLVEICKELQGILLGGYGSHEGDMVL